MTGQEYIDLSKVKIRGLHEENGIHIHIEDVIRLLDDYKKQLTLTDVREPFFCLKKETVIGPQKCDKQCSYCKMEESLQ